MNESGRQCLCRYVISLRLSEGRCVSSRLIVVTASGLAGVMVTAHSCLILGPTLASRLHLINSTRL